MEISPYFLSETKQMSLTIPKLHHHLTTKTIQEHPVGFITQSCNEMVWYWKFWV